MSIEPFRIGIDGEWSIEDWYVFPRTVNQVYSFLYSISQIRELDEFPDEDDHLYITYVAHPWRGGYSAVNFYNYLQNYVPKDSRPKVISIQYSSPGWIELGLLVTVSLNMRKIVKAICDSGKDIISFYNEFYKGLKERRLLNISVKREELRFRQEQIEFMKYSSSRLSELMAFDGLSELEKITPNELAVAKILLSFYRRVRTLADYQKDSKADFDPNAS